MFDNKNENVEFHCVCGAVLLGLKNLKKHCENATDTDLHFAVDKYSVKNETGVKYDQDKDQWHLLEPWFTKEVVQVLTVGAKKYSPDNWKKVPNARNRYYDALMRHITAWFEGEENDPEDGLSHLAHAACCIYFLRYFDSEKEQS